MLNLKTFQNPPKGIEIIDHDNTTRIQRKPSTLLGKIYIGAGIFDVIFGIALPVLFKEFGVIENDQFLLVCISFLFCFGFSAIFMIVLGHITGHTIVNIDIDSDKNLTINIERPIFHVNPVTFYSNHNIKITQTMKQIQNRDLYYLNISSDDDKKYTFPSYISNLHLIWLLYTLSELYGQKAEPLGPKEAITEYENLLKSKQSNISDPFSTPTSNTTSKNEFY